jgi:uncharacterized membrane protein
MSVAAQSSTPARRLTREATIVAGLTLAAFILRFSQLHQSLFGDEVLAYNEIHGHSLGELIRIVHTGVESSPPLFFVLAWLSSKLGDPTVWIRLPSLLLGTATIPITYLLGRETIGRLGGLSGAAVIALSPFAYYYGIEARPYATLTFFVAASTLALVRAIDTRSPRWWACYALCAAAAAYTHYTAIFVLAVQGAWSLWVCRDRIREPLLASGAAILLYLPWLPELHGSELQVYAQLEPLTFHNVRDDVLRPIAGDPLATLRQIPTHLGLIALIACFAIGAVCIALHLPRSASGLTQAALSKPALLLWLALAAPVGLWLYSRLHTDIWEARSLISSTPAAALVLGGALVALPRRGSAPLTVVVAIVLAFGLVRAVTPRYSRPQFRPAAQYLDRMAAQADPIVVYPVYLGLDNALYAELQRPHTIIRGVPKHWPAIPAHGSAFLVAAAQTVALFHLTEHPPGYRLVGRIDYGGSLPFTIDVYRRALNAG